MGWIGVDLDGTLAVYRGWNGGEIGEPVPAMVERVKRWLAEGQDVRIFTARVGVCGEYSDESLRTANEDFAREQETLIGDWCERHLGVRLKVTAVKDFTLVELWDDRAIQVVANTGQIVAGAVRMIDPKPWPASST